MKNEELRMKNCGVADATKHSEVPPDTAKRTVWYVEKGGRIMKVETRGQGIVASSLIPYLNLTIWKTPPCSREILL